MEQWREATDDFDSALILLAVTAISAEKLTRADLDPKLRNLQKPISPDDLSFCNVSSIAAATGLNRETARRKINRLVEQGWLVRDPEGSIAYASGFSQRSTVRALLRLQLETIRKATNDFMLYGALKVADERPPAGTGPPRAQGRRKRVDGRGGTS